MSRVSLVIDVITSLADTCSAGERVYIPLKVLRGKLPDEAISQTLIQLEDEGKIIIEDNPLYELSNTKSDSLLPGGITLYHSDNECFIIQTTERFKHMPIKDEKEQKLEQKVIDNSLAYWIDYSEKGRKIILNGKALISQPNFSSENEIVFSYIYRKQNQKILKADIEKDNRIRLRKRLHNIINDLGFSSQLRALFFEISQNHITFHNPIYKQELNIRQIPYIEPEELVRSCKK